MKTKEEIIAEMKSKDIDTSKECNPPQLPNEGFCAYLRRLAPFKDVEITETDNTRTEEAGRQSAQQEITNLNSELRCKLDVIRDYTTEVEKLKHELHTVASERFRIAKIVADDRVEIQCLKQQLTQKDKKIVEFRAGVGMLKIRLTDFCETGYIAYAKDVINEIFPDRPDTCKENKFCAKHGVTHSKYDCSEEKKGE